MKKSHIGPLRVRLGVHIERSRWVLARWALGALLVAASVAFVLAQLSLSAVVAG